MRYRAGQEEYKLRFVIIESNKNVSEHIRLLLQEEHQECISVPTEEAAIEIIKEHADLCIIFDRMLCGEDYRSFISKFIHYNNCYFVPLQEKWTIKEMSDGLRARLTYILRYDCTLNDIRDCIESYEVRIRYQSTERNPYDWYFKDCL